MRTFKERVLKMVKSQLVAGSAVLFFGSLVSSLCSYLYHLLMGRMLGPESYGTLASLISVAYILGVPMSTISLTVVKFVSQLRGEGRPAAIIYFCRWMNRKALIFSLIGGLAFWGVSPWVASFLHLEDATLLIIVVLGSLLGIFLSINLSILQGFLRFGWCVAAGIINIASKLVSALLLVRFGFQVFGATLAMLLGTVSGYFVSLLPIRGTIGEVGGEDVVETKDVFAYASPVFFSFAAFASLYTTDIVLAKHFLSAQEAGFYSALAVLGKIIFFAAGPIITAVFPMISERYAKKQPYLDLFKLSLGLVGLICVGGSLAYSLLPRLMVRLLFGDDYLPAAQHLWLFAIFLSLYSLTYLLVNSYLSIKRVKVVFLPVVAAILQVVLILIFHQTVAQVALMSVISLTLLLVSLLGYSFYDQRAKTG